MSDPREPLDTPSGGETEVDLPEDDIDDGSGEGDQPEDGLEPENEEADQPDPQELQLRQQQRRSRAAETITNLRGRAQNAETEIASLRRELNELRNRPAPIDPMAAQRELEAENARLEMMSPAEQARYFYQKGQQETRVALAQQQFLAQDSQDRRDYAALKRDIPAATRLETQVEATLQQLRQQGIFGIGREDILKNLLGDEVLSRSRQGVGRARQDGQRRIRQQTTQPAQGRGDVARGAPTRTQRDADRALLQSVTGDSLF